MPPIHTSRVWLWLTISLCVVLTHATSPLQMQWSSSTYGPDGPWHALTVRFGHPPALVDLYPASEIASFIPNPNICSNHTLHPKHSPCATYQSGLWNYNDSHSADSDLVVLPPGGAQFSDPLTFLFGGQTVLDTMYPVNDDTIFISRSSITTMDWAYYVHPNGKTYPPAIGTLALGGTGTTFRVIGSALNQSLIHSLPHPYVDENIPPYDLMSKGITKSSSYGMHIGSVRANIAPSMFFGGYDKSRVLGPVLSQAVTANDTFLVNLVDISIETSPGRSPFSFRSKSGLLAQGNSSIGPTGFNVYLEPGTPYMFLPKSSCEAIIESAELPVRHDPDLNLYLWDTKDPRYSLLVNLSSWLNFRFRGPTGKEVHVKAPWQLFDLTLDTPLVDKPASYFPCAPYAGTEYALGRAFLQAAFVGVNWRPTHAPSYWFLAQAPGPNTAQTPLIAEIDPLATSIAGLDTTTDPWISTWNGYLQLLPLKASGNAAATGRPEHDLPAQTTGLSTGAKVGLGLGVGLGVPLLLLVAALAVWLVRRKRRAARARAAVDSETAAAKNYAPYGNRHEAEGHPINEAEGTGRLGLPDNPAEVGDDASAVTLRGDSSTSKELPGEEPPELEVGKAVPLEKGDSDSITSKRSS